MALNQALIAGYLNDFGAARAALSRALSADPKSENARLLERQLPELERARTELDALTSNAPAVERAHRLQALGLTAEASQVWQLALASGSLSDDQRRAGLSFVLEQGDAASVEALHSRYSALFARPENGSLEAAYRERHDLSQRLLAVWPSLGLPLLSWPG